VHAYLKNKLGVEYMPIKRATHEVETGGSWFEVSPEKVNETLSQKQAKHGNV
jgi:hypothetical protein